MRIPLAITRSKDLVRGSPYLTKPKSARGPVATELLNRFGYIVPHPFIHCFNPIYVFLSLGLGTELS